MGVSDHKGKKINADTFQKCFLQCLLFPATFSNNVYYFLRAGFAYIASACATDGTSVSIVEDHGGFQSESTVAHELGHRCVHVTMAAYFRQIPELLWQHIAAEHTSYYGVTMAAYLCQTHELVRRPVSCKHTSYYRSIFLSNIQVTMVAYLRQIYK
jgi:hypothetical protein